MGKKSSATAEVEGVEIQTRDRIADAAVLHVRVSAAQAAFKNLAKHAGLVGEKLYVQQAGAVHHLRAGEQTMLFETVEEATLARIDDLVGALENAARAAYQHYDPAEHE